MRSSTSSRRLSAAQHRLAVVADGGAFELQQRRRQRTGGRRQRERRDALLDHLRDRLELRQSLDARLRLRGLARFGAEAVDEFLQMGALGLLLGPGGRQEPRFFRPPRLEIVVAAGVKIELAFMKMQNGVDRIVQQLAVVTDDERGVRVFL